MNATLSSEILKYSRHPLLITPKGSVKKFEIAKNKKRKRKNCILHTWKYINLTRNTLKSKIETKGTLLGERDKRVSRLSATAKISVIKDSSVIEDKMYSCLR